SLGNAVRIAAGPVLEDIAMIGGQACRDPCLIRGLKGPDVGPGDGFEMSWLKGKPQVANPNGEFTTWGCQDIWPRFRAFLPVLVSRDESRLVQDGPSGRLSAVRCKNTP